MSQKGDVAGLELHPYLHLVKVVVSLSAKPGTLFSMSKQTVKDKLIERVRDECFTYGSVRELYMEVDVAGYKDVRVVNVGKPRLGPTAQRKQAAKEGIEGTWKAYIDTEFSDEAASAFYMQRLSGLTATLESHGAELIASFECSKVDWRSDLSKTKREWSQMKTDEKGPTSEKTKVLDRLCSFARGDQTRPDTLVLSGLPASWVGPDGPCLDVCPRWKGRHRVLSSYPPQLASFAIEYDRMVSAPLPAALEDKGPPPLEEIAKETEKDSENAKEDSDSESENGEIKHKKKHKSKKKSHKSHKSSKHKRKDSNKSESSSSRKSASNSSSGSTNNSSTSCSSSSSKSVPSNTSVLGAPSVQRKVVEDVTPAEDTGDNWKGMALNARLRSILDLIANTGGGANCIRRWEVSRVCHCKDAPNDWIPEAASSPSLSSSSFLSTASPSSLPLYSSLLLPSACQCKCELHVMLSDHKVFANVYQTLHGKLLYHRNSENMVRYKLDFDRTGFLSTESVQSRNEKWLSILAEGIRRGVEERQVAFEKLRKQKEDEERKKKLEEQKEEDERKRVEEIRLKEEKQRRAEEEKRRQEEQEQERKKKEAEERRQSEEERKRIAEEERRQARERHKAEEEKKRIEEEEERRKKKDSDLRKDKRKYEDERMRLEEEKQRRMDESRTKKEERVKEEEARKKNEERRKREEEEHNERAREEAEHLQKKSSKKAPPKIKKRSEQSPPRKKKSSKRRSSSKEMKKSRSRSRDASPELSKKKKIEISISGQGKPVITTKKVIKLARRTDDGASRESGGSCSSSGRNYHSSSGSSGSSGGGRFKIETSKDFSKQSGGKTRDSSRRRGRRSGSISSDKEVERENEEEISEVVVDPHAITDRWSGGGSAVFETSQSASSSSRRKRAEEEIEQEESEGKKKLKKHKKKRDKKESVGDTNESTEKFKHESIDSGTGRKEKEEDVRTDKFKYEGRIEEDAKAEKRVHPSNDTDKYNENLEKMRNRSSVDEIERAERKRKVDEKSERRDIVESRTDKTIYPSKTSEREKEEMPTEGRRKLNRDILDFASHSALKTNYHSGVSGGSGSSCDSNTSNSIGGGSHSSSSSNSGSRSASNSGRDSSGNTGENESFSITFTTRKSTSEEKKSPFYSTHREQDELRVRDTAEGRGNIGSDSGASRNSSCGNSGLRRSSGSGALGTSSGSSIAARSGSLVSNRTSSAPVTVSAPCLEGPRTVTTKPLKAPQQINEDGGEDRLAKLRRAVLERMSKPADSPTPALPPPMLPANPPAISVNVVKVAESLIVPRTVTSLAKASSSPALKPSPLALVVAKRPPTTTPIVHETKVTSSTAPVIVSVPLGKASPAATVPKPTAVAKGEKSSSPVPTTPAPSPKAQKEAKLKMLQTMKQQEELMRGKLLELKSKFGPASSPKPKKRTETPQKSSSLKISVEGGAAEEEVDESLNWLDEVSEPEELEAIINS